MPLAVPHCVHARLPWSLEHAQLKRAVLFKVGFGWTATARRGEARRAAPSQRSRAGEQEEKNGKHVEAAISRGMTVLWEERGEIMRA